MRHVVAVVGSSIAAVGVLLYSPILAWAAAGQVESASGEVWDTRGQQTIALTPGTVVQPADVIWTGKAGQVRLVMRDDSVVFLGPRSRMRIERYDVDQQGLVAGAFYLLWGKARFLVTELKRATSSFSVSTQTANIGVRGTEFGVIVPPPDLNGIQPPTTDAMLFKGAIFGRGLHGETVVLAPGQYLHFTVSQVPQERAITPGDIQRLGIHTLAPGLVEPQPLPLPVTPVNPDNMQQHGPGSVGKPNIPQHTPNVDHPTPPLIEHPVHPVHPIHPVQPPHPPHPPHPPKPPHP